jgi:hypothetical protein
MRPSPRRLVGVIAAAMAALATLGSVPAAPPETLLLYTGEQRGYLEPCGCTKPQIGGLPRRAAFLASPSRRPNGIHRDGQDGQDGKAARLPSDHPVYPGPVPCLNTVVIDNGDMVEDPGRQSQLKAETLASFYRQNGYAAVNLGECDYRLGFGYLRALQATAKVPFLSANVRLGERPAFSETTTASGVTLVGLLAGSFGPEVQRWNPMLRVESPEAALARLEPSLKEVGRVVLLFHGAPDEARPLARRFPWLTAIVTAHEADDYRPEPLVEAGVPMVNAGRKGKVVGCLELNTGGVRPHPPVTLGPEWEDESRTRALMNRYLARVGDEGLLQKVPRLPDPDGRHFAGTAACQSCHAGAHKVWKDSAHARAYQTLVTAGHDKDPDCVGCHVVGLGAESGFHSLDRTPHLKDVGCESCHGGGAAHAKAPSQYKMPRTGAQACATCHVPEHSPNFDYAKFWAKIRH